MQPAITAVIFDLDGTLIDSVGDIASACNAALAERGFGEQPRSRYPGFVGYGLRHLVSIALPPEVLTTATIDAVYARVSELYAGSALATTRPYPGVAATLAELVGCGVPLAVLSNKPHATCVHVVAALFPGVRFAAVEGIRTRGRGKPDPVGALQIARLLRVRPADVLIVGDGDTDMMTARAAGMQAVGATWGYRSVRDLLAAGAERLLLRPFDSVRLIEGRSAIR